MTLCCECHNSGLELRVTDDGEEICHSCWHSYEAAGCVEVCGWHQLPTQQDLAEAALDYENEKADHQIRLRKDEGLL